MPFYTNIPYKMVYVEHYNALLLSSLHYSSSSNVRTEISFTERFFPSSLLD